MPVSNNFNTVWVLPAGTTFFTWNFETNACESNVAYYFRHESKADLAYVTIRGVAIRYKNIAPCSLTVTIVGMFNSLSANLDLGLTNPSGTGNAVLNRQYYGAPPPLAQADGESYTAFFYFGSDFTDEDFQIQLSMIGDGINQFMIEQVSVIGDSEEISR